MTPCRPRRGIDHGGHGVVIQFRVSPVKAIVVDRAGPPDVLQIRELSTPNAKRGWVLIRVEAFGLNRSEMFTRQGHSGAAVQFPRVLGIECVGTVESAPSTRFIKGQKVAAVMGGMGRDFDGGYAQFALIPEQQVLVVETSLPWEQFGAIPETYLTAWFCLRDAMDVRAGQTVLIRGATSSVGMAAIALAKGFECEVIATTRNESKRAILLENGADDVVIDRGAIAESVRALEPEGVNAVLELIGTTTLVDSLRTAARHGIVCFAGILGNEWVLERFEPLVQIPSTVKLTVLTTHILNADNATAPLQEIVRGVESGRIRLNIDRVFDFDEIVAAHRYMESNAATGKLVVRVRHDRHPPVFSSRSY